MTTVVAGLSMMVLLASSPLIACGAVIGWWIAGKSRQPIATSQQPAQAPSRADIDKDQRASAPTPNIDPQEPENQRGLLLAAAGVGAGMWVVIAVGFYVHDQQAPRPINAGFIPAALIFIGACCFALRRLWRARDELRHAFSLPQISLRRSKSNWKAERDAWHAQLVVDPLRRRYLDMIKAGDSFWTPQRVEYDVDPRATTCCEHLAPTEASMRAAGLRAQLLAAGAVDVQCRIDMNTLREKIALPECVAYRELEMYDRSIEDPARALLECDACRSCIWVVHPREASAHTPFFPAQAK